MRKLLRKIMSAYHYLLDRLVEFRICMKEFAVESKLSADAYEVHFKSRLLVDVHSVEKGIGLKNSKPGHSSVVVVNLINRLFEYIHRGYDIEDFSFRETVRIISAYIDFQKSFDTEKFPAFFEIEKKYRKLCDKLGIDYIKTVEIGFCAGAKIIDKEELLVGTTFEFDRFIKSRHSIRSFTENAINQEDIIKAVELANQSPSACNRQPNHIYFTSDKEKVGQIDCLITGSSGFKGETPNYLVVTTDRAAFAKEEQFQWYINGGIYLAYLSLGLHSLGIGHCIMQWKAFYQTEKDLKKLLGISKQEAIIAVVGCGYYSTETKCICAQRKDSNDVLKVVP